LLVAPALGAGRPRGSRPRSGSFAAKSRAAQPASCQLRACYAFRVTKRLEEVVADVRELPAEGEEGAFM